MKNLNTKYYVVTGGASGLGEAAAKQIVKAGGNVLLLDLNEKTGKQVQQEFEKVRANSALFVKCDILNEAQVKQALQDADTKFKLECGGLVNCAGVAWAATVVHKDMGPHALAAFQKVMEINVIGNFNVLRLVVHHMVQNTKPGDDNERGVLIQTASVAAFDGQVGQAAYSASKGAIVGMTLPIARELGKHGIRCLTIAPDTPMGAKINDKVKQGLMKQTPFPNRLGNPEEFGDLCVHMIQNTFLNGETIRLDGSIRMGYM